MAQDLRGYLDLVKRRKPGDFEIVSKLVDPRFEITALVVKLEREGKRRPVILFENVKGTRFPVLTNLHASRPRLAAAMHAAPEATQSTYLRAMQSEVLAQPALSNPEEIYGEVLRRKQMDPINHILVAIDVLTNMVGNSKDSFDTILKDEQADVERFIPPLEAQFIRHYDPYNDVEAFGDAVRIGVCVPAPYLAQAQALLDGAPLAWGAIPQREKR